MLGCRSLVLAALAALDGAVRRLARSASLTLVQAVLAGLRGETRAGAGTGHNAGLLLQGFVLMLLGMMQCWRHTQSGYQWITLVSNRLSIDYGNAVRGRWRWHSTVHNGYIMWQRWSLLLLWMLLLLLGRRATRSGGHTLLQMLQYLFDAHMRGQIVIVLLARRLPDWLLGAQYIE